jgi:tetratricopeptide (TPR) repeat protein
VDTQTRHALKQDNLVQVTQTGFDWLQENRSRVIRIGSAALAAIAVLTLGLAVYSQRATAANLGLGEALDTYTATLAQPGQPPAPGERIFASVSDRAKAANPMFLAVAHRYSMLSPGKTALYFAGLSAIDMGENGQAESDLEQVVSSGDSALASLARLALAGLYRQTGRTGQAIELYNRLIAKPTSAVPADEAQLELAALYESVNPAEANRIYAQLKSGKSAAAEIAAQKLQQK